MSSSRALFALEPSIPRTTASPFLHPFFYCSRVAACLPTPTTSSSSSSAIIYLTATSTNPSGGGRRRKHNSLSFVQRSSTCVGKVEEQADVEVANGYTMTQFCDKMIEYFMNDRPQTKDWRKLLVFREDWKKYRESFFNRCQVRAAAENDPSMKKKLNSLARKMKKIDDEIEKNSNLLKEIQDSPLDLNAIVARRRKDFTGEFFRHLNFISDTFDCLEDRDAMSRLGAKCLSAVSVYDSTVEHLDTLEVAQSKFDDILNSSSLEAACEKVDRLSKGKELDSSLILLINGAWAAAKDSTTMKNEVHLNKGCSGKQCLIESQPPTHTNRHPLVIWTTGMEVKEIMYHIYRATLKALKSMAPPEIKLLKYLLNIEDPEERFSALATAFSPGDGHEQKDANALYTTPKELHKWIKMMLDAYHLNKETDVIEARQMSDPMVIQRLIILKETVEEEYMKQYKVTDEKESEPEPES